MGYAGDEVHGELHSTDASSGVEITLYRAGSTDSRTIQDNEYLEIHSLELITAAGGDAYVFIGADSTLGSGETAARGTFAANGGRSGELCPPYAGIKGGKPYVVAPAGAVDVVIKGTIRRA
jgi:hypothetical protein